MAQKQAASQDPALSYARGSRTPFRLSQATKDFIAGGASGIACILASQPLDTLKTRMQFRSASMEFAGAWDCLVKTVKNEGLLGLYKGMLSPLLGISFVNAVAFTAYGRAKTYVHGNLPQPLSLGEIATCGAIAGFTQAFVIAPIDLVKVRLQIQGGAGNRQYRGPIDCVRHVLRTNGLRGMFRGLGATIARDVPSFAAWYACFEWLKRKFSSKGVEMGPLQLLIAGAAAGLAQPFATYPLDTAKTLVQTQPDPLRGGRLQYRSFTSAMGQVVAVEGLRGVYRGFLPTIVRALPASGATFLTYEAVSKYLKAH